MDPMHRGPQGRAGRDSGALARTVQLVADAYLVTVNPVDGSEIEICPPAGMPPPPGRRTPEDRAALRRAAEPAAPVGEAALELPLLEREEERERLVRLLARGRSIRLTGRPGVGRTALLDVVATDCADLAPDGVIRLTGHGRTPTDLLHELFAVVHDAPWHRLGRAELLATVAEIGAVVVLDDVEFGGAALDELLRATPECAFLISARPEIAPPVEDTSLVEVVLPGLSRTACLKILEHAVRRPLLDAEADWAADLWFESEGLPLRFLQAGAVLRHRDATIAAAGDAAAGTEDAAPGEGYGTVLPPLSVGLGPVDVAAALSEPAREALRYALALGGELPHQSHLPALVDDPQADATLAELTAAGLATPTGPGHRLSGDLAEQLTAAGFVDRAGADDRALRVAQHYAWWAGHPSVTPDRVAAEAGAVLAAVQATKRGGHPSTAALLAHTAAPVLAAALYWSAWERALRGGQEAARLAGEVAEEAYFHHELGVLALCLDNTQRARAELEASIGLRGALADKRGAVAGRRALALVEDRTTLAGAGGAGAAAAAGGLAGVGASGWESGGGKTAGPPAPFAGILAGADTTGPTVLNAAAHGADRAPGPDDRDTGARPVLSNTRRNLAAAGAGALLAAVLGAFMTLGNTSGGDDPSESVKPDSSTSQEDDELPADEPDEDSDSTAREPQPTPSGEPSASGSPSESPSDGSSGPTGGPSEPTGEPSEPSDGPSDPSDDPSEPSDDPSDPSDDPTGPTDDPSEPTGEPSEPDPTPTESAPSATASPPSPSASTPESPGASPSETPSGLTPA